MSEAIHKSDTHDEFNEHVGDAHDEFNEHVGDVKKLLSLEQQAQWDAYIDELQLNQ